jgi:hypothetical protein
MSEEKTVNLADIENKLRTKGSLYCKAVNCIDRTLMVQNEELLSELSSELSRVPCQYEATVVSWDAKSSSQSVVVSFVLLIEHLLDSTKKYALGVPQGLFVRADHALGAVVEFVMNCQQPEFVARILDTPNGLYVSGFGTQRSEVVVVPLISRVDTKSGNSDVSIVVTRHQQLADGELFLKTFKREDCRFYSWTRYLAVLCANKRQHVSLEFFEFENPEQVNSVIAPQVLAETEFVELQDFTGFIQSQLEKLVHEVQKKVKVSFENGFFA